jgi:hypothetical protein
MTRAWALVAAFVLPASCARAARADEKQQCVTASEQAQDLRDKGRYGEAHDAFATCARDVCPALVRHDCTGWLAELEQAWPSVVFAAKDDVGNDLVDVQVRLDGEVVVKQLDGKPFPVDPGQHVFRFESGKFPPVDQPVMIHAGEKSRVLNVVIHKNAPDDEGTPPGPTPPGNDGQHRRVTASEPGPPVLAWVFAGVAVAAFGTEAYLGVTGVSDLNALKGLPCAKTGSCDAGTVQAIRVRFLVADISLGVGVVSTLLSAYFFLAPRDPKSKPAKAGTLVDFTPLPGGGMASVGGRF